MSFMSFVYEGGVLLERSRRALIAKKKSIWRDCSKIRILFESKLQVILEMEIETFAEKLEITFRVL